ncbi:hypothetical protein D9M72_273530 [compost metagenome]
MQVGLEQVAEKLRVPDHIALQRHVRFVPMLDVHAGEEGAAFPGLAAADQEQRRRHLPQQVPVVGGHQQLAQPSGRTVLLDHQAAFLGPADVQDLTAGPRERHPRHFAMGMHARPQQAEQVLVEQPRGVIARVAEQQVEMGTELLGELQTPFKGRGAGFGGNGDQDLLDRAHGNRPPLLKCDCGHTSLAGKRHEAPVLGDLCLRNNGGIRQGVWPLAKPGQGRSSPATACLVLSRVTSGISAASALAGVRGTFRPRLPRAGR